MELKDDFEDVLARVLVASPALARRFLRWVITVAQPLLGAGSDSVKRHLERVVGQPSVFSRGRATVRNCMLNVLLYPALITTAAVAAAGWGVLSGQVKGAIFAGVAVAAIEWMLRMRESLFRGIPSGEAPLRGSIYAPLANLLGRALAAGLGGKSVQSQVGFDGFYDERFDDKAERDRRYGEVYRLEDLGGGYLFRLEFPRHVPSSSLTDELGLPREMPDYEYDIELHDGHLIVRGTVADSRVRKLTCVAAAFPPEFTTRVQLARPVAGFRHRYREKVLEIALPVQG
jgi:hypothetical protein